MRISSRDFLIAVAAEGPIETAAADAGAVGAVSGTLIK
jgi:hypothetical protein